ncbi:hypothetical protein ACXYMN_00845 [Roseivivax sp. CAU 1753]
MITLLKDLIDLLSAGIRGASITNLPLNNWREDPHRDKLGGTLPVRASTAFPD